MAWDHEIPADGLFNRTVIGEPLLLYRTAAGAVVALADRCSKGIKLVATERCNPTDQGVTAQAVKVMAANPDAVCIFSAGTPGALPHTELVKRGCKGLIDQTEGVANNDFLRIGGQDLEAGCMTVAPVLVAEQLPDTHPTKKAGVDFVQRFEARHAPARAACSRPPPGTRWRA